MSESLKSTNRTIFWGIILGAIIGVVVSKAMDHQFPHARAAGEEPVQGKERLLQQGETFRSAANLIAPSVVNISTIVKVRYTTGGDTIESLFFGGPYRPPQIKEGRKVQGIGSGFVIDADKGYIITNNHVVDGGDEWIVRLQDKREFPAKLVGTDHQTDIAILQIEATNLVGAKMGNSDDVQVGDWVLAAGNPFGMLEQTVTAGIISAKGRKGLGLNRYEDFLQTDAAINEGNSGGPLVDLSGEVIGINTAIVSKSGGYQGIGFSIPINQARKIGEQIIKSGHVARGWMGIDLSGLPMGAAKALNLDIDDGAGLIVKGVFLKGPAQKAGIHPGDIVYAVDGKKLDEAGSLSDLIANQEPGKTVQLKLYRQEDQKYVVKEVSVQLEDQPAGWGKR